MSELLQIPDLSGVATKELVEQIGSGSFKASYINWSRTMNLLRKHAPGWMCEAVFNSEGSLVHRAPVGGYLLIRYRHVSGFTTPEVPQAIMDHRNSSITFEKITSRDVTDTQRRGACLVAAMQFGLAYELWAKMPLESGYGGDDAEPAPKAAPAAKKAAQATSGGTSNAPKSASGAPAADAKASEPTEADFKKAADAKGLCAEATAALLAKIKGKYGVGIDTLATKDAAWVEAENAKFQDEDY
jgi:hypothetical protein